MRKVVFLALLAALLPAIAASAETIAEKQMAQKIGSQLKESGKLHNYRIAVKYHDGIAFLEGTVTSVEQRTTAVRLAQHIKGVSQVEYKLEIPGKSDIPSEPKEQIEARPSAGNGERFQLASALERASQESGDNGNGGVMHAYQPVNEGQMMPAQQPRMMPNNVPRMNPMAMRRNNMPLPARTMPGMQMPVRQVGGSCPTCNGGPGMGPAMGQGMGPGMGGMGGGADAVPVGFVPQGSARGPSYDNAQMPGYAWPSYASYPNYAALTYPQQYSPTAWPYIGPFYPYPQVPLAWRKVSLEWDAGWWFLDFSSHNSSH